MSRLHSHEAACRRAYHQLDIRRLLSRELERFSRAAKTPREIIDKLAQHVIAAAKDPTNVAQLTALGIEPNGTTPEEFRTQIDREQPQFDAAIKAANLQLQ